MIRFIKKFQWKTHLIKILGLGFLTTNLRIRPLKSQLATVGLFLCGTPSQKFKRNGHRLTVQTAGQVLATRTISTVPRVSSATFSFFFFYLTNSHHRSTAQYPRPNELIPFVLTTHISWPIIQLFDLFFFFYLFSFAYFSFPIFFNNTQFNLLNTNPKNLIFT